MNHRWRVWNRGAEFLCFIRTWRVSQNSYHSCLSDFFPCLFFCDLSALFWPFSLRLIDPYQHAIPGGRLVRLRPGRVVGCRNLCTARCSRWFNRCRVWLDRCCRFSYRRSSCTSILICVEPFSIISYQAFLPSSEPPFNSSHCKSCHKPMELLVQMWCPFENSPMDRALYIWGCARIGCQGENGRQVPWDPSCFIRWHMTKLDSSSSLVTIFLVFVRGEVFDLTKSMPRNLNKNVYVKAQIDWPKRRLINKKRCLQPIHLPWVFFPFDIHRGYLMLRTHVSDRQKSSWQCRPTYIWHERSNIWPHSNCAGE